MRNLVATLMFASLLLTGCGGGGGSTATTTSSSGSGTTTTTGGSGSTTTAYNVVNAEVDQGPAALLDANEAAVNIMYVNVTVCAPGSTTNCQTIDHVQVDTGSQGLRLIGSVLNTSLLSALTPVSMNGGTLAECTQFVDGYSWGAIYSADVHIGGSDTATTGESAPNIPIQVIGSTYAVPTNCSTGSSNTTAEDTVATFGANGIIGVGLFDQDCGSGCVTVADNGYYYSCTSTSDCNTPTEVPLASQVTNPVYALSAQSGISDTNGVIVELPAVTDTGAATVTGTLVFGIGTQSNNALPASPSVLYTDPYYGYISVQFLGSDLPDSYLDSGSNAIYFPDTSIPTCTDNGFMCPGSATSLSATSLSATITGYNPTTHTYTGSTATATFSIANADYLFNTYNTYAAFANLGGSSGTTGTSTFAFGLPFFYGTNIYSAMENVDAGGYTGPYFAY